MEHIGVTRRDAGDGRRCRKQSEQRKRYGSPRPPARPGAPNSALRGGPWRQTWHTSLGFPLLCLTPSHCRVSDMYAHTDTELPQNSDRYYTVYCNTPRDTPQNTEKGCKRLQKTAHEWRHREAADFGSRQGPPRGLEWRAS